MNQDQKAKNEVLLSRYRGWNPPAENERGREQRQQMLIAAEVFGSARVNLDAQKLAEDLHRGSAGGRGLSEEQWAAELAKHTGRKAG